MSATMARESKSIKELRAAHEGKLPAFAWPGAYPIAYFDAENNTLCYRCANDNDPEFNPPLRSYAVIEEGHTYCDECNAVIFEDEAGE